MIRGNYNIIESRFGGTVKSPTRFCWSHPVGSHRGYVPNSATRREIS
jgi:hypothetical protein